MSIRVSPIALENKKMHARIKKGIIRKSPRMIIARIIQRHGMARERANQVVNISPNEKSQCGVPTGSRSVQGSCINQRSGAEKKETTFPNKERYKRKF
jgi:hypothetical protein